MHASGAPASLVAAWLFTLSGCCDLAPVRRVVAACDSSPVGGTCDEACTASADCTVGGSANGFGCVNGTCRYTAFNADGTECTTPNDCAAVRSTVCTSSAQCGSGACVRLHSSGVATCQVTLDPGAGAVCSAGVPYTTMTATDVDTSSSVTVWGCPADCTGGVCANTPAGQCLATACACEDDSLCGSFKRFEGTTMTCSAP